MTGPLDTAEIDRLRGWIGREERVEDVLTPGLVDRFRATFDGRLHRGDAGDAPLGIHWCLPPPPVPAGELGPDGHPARGGFLPPVPFESRMWAGGAIRFHAPLRTGDAVERHARIASLVQKEGRSGPLVFVAVEYAYRARGSLAISERHDVVYRPASPPPPSPVPSPAPPADAPPGAFVGDAVTLFRYSAMTFNGHRIHYDRDYATGEEGYPGLVVHGPLQATLLMNAAATAARTPSLTFDYRGLSPLTDGHPVTVAARDGRAWLEKPDGTVTFEARFAPLEAASPASGGTGGRP